MPAAHGFPTIADGGACDADESPWILSCGYDAAGELLEHLYDGLVKPSRGVTGKLREFGRTPMSKAASSPRWPTRDFSSFQKTAHKACRAASTSRSMDAAQHRILGRTYPRQAGYDRWADANRIVVLYPQVNVNTLRPFNPRGCWDWWGYSGVDYAARDGVQLSAVRRMLEALGAT